MFAVLLPSLAQLPAIHRYVKPDYWLGLPIVPVILLGYVFSGIYAVVTAGLYIERKTHVLAWIAGAGAVLNIAICIVAAPRWGMVSVAWATPAAYALMACFVAWQANRVLRRAVGDGVSRPGDLGRDSDAALFGRPCIAYVGDSRRVGRRPVGVDAGPLYSSTYYERLFPSR